MNVHCPNCGCVYDIKTENLPKSAGNGDLGYGWWLKCYKCQHKWWLKNSVVEKTTNEPMVADVQTKIRKIEQLKGNKKTVVKKKRKRKWWGSVVLLACLALFCFYKKDAFYEYLLAKNRRLSSNMMSNVVMQDVKYFLTELPDNDGVRITINGKIFNKDMTVVKLNGVKVFVCDSHGKEIKSWSEKLQYGYIVSGDYIDFSVSETLVCGVSDIKVEVSAF